MAGPDTRADELRGLPGASEEQIRAWLASQESEDAPAATAGRLHERPDFSQPLEVWPTNWPALLLFLELQTQWLRNAQGRPMGLMYASVQAALWCRGEKKRHRRELYEALVDMQHAVVEGWHEL